MFEQTKTKIKKSPDNELAGLIPLIIMYGIKKITKEEFKQMVELLLKKNKETTTVKQETINILEGKFKI